MSSLATSPPRSGGSPPPQNRAMMQTYQEAQLRQQSMEDDSMWQGGAEEYTMEEMAYMRRSGMGRDMEKTRIPGGAMYPGEGRAYMQDMRYHGGGSGSAYMGHMAADRDYSREVDEYGEYPVGMKTNSVSSAVREVASRMNEVRLGHAHSAHMMTSHHMDQHDMAEYARAGGDMMSMRDRMSAHMMSMYHGHEAKMQHAYGTSMMMNLGGRMIKSQPGDSFAFQDSLMGGHLGSPYIAAQPPCLPFAAMHASGYGSGVAGVGMGGASNSFDIIHRGSASAAPQTAKHNKYCHFCQHVKVRQSGMLACCNKDCTRRFCEHCLSKSIGDDVNPQTSAAWVNGQWHCPVCRKLCCCAIGDCDKNHRHCKAYRYRVRRAEQQAVKRAGTGCTDAGGSPADSPRGEDFKPVIQSQARLTAVKPAQAVEISDEKAADNVAQGTWQAIAKVVPAAKSQPSAPSSLKIPAPAPASDTPLALSRVKTEHEGEAQPLAPACSPASSAAPSAAVSILASPSSMAGSPSTAYARMRQPRRAADMQGAPAPAAPVDLNDVQTMADSWLRLLQQEEEEEVDGDFAHSESGSVGGRGVRGRGGTPMFDFESGSGSFGEDAVMLMHQRMGSRIASKSTLQQSGSSESLNRIMSMEEGGGGMIPSSSSQSLSELMQRSPLPRNTSTDNFLMRDTLSRNVSNVSLTEMVRNYSSASLAAVMEQNETWGNEEADAIVHTKMGGGGDFQFLQADNGRSMHHAYHQPQQQQASTGKRMHRTHSHNKLVHEAVSAHTAVGRGMPRPASFEKLSRQCPDQDPSLTND